MALKYSTKYTGSYLALLMGFFIFLLGLLGYVYFGGIQNVATYATYIDYWYVFMAIGGLLFLAGLYWLRPPTWR
jgi:hypothetical protein